MSKRSGMTVNSIIEAGTPYRVGSRDGELRVAEKDLNVELVEVRGDYAVVALPDGILAYVDGEHTSWHLT